MTPVQRLVMAGVDYRQTALPEREQVTFTAAEARALLASARTVAGVREAMVLSTCNRTEFYLVVTSPDAVEAWLTYALGSRSSPTLLGALGAGLRWDDAAAGHLLRVACGLESQLLGDGHIAGQVRAAFALATGCRSAGPRLLQLAQRVSAAARRARSSTELAFGAPSLGSAVAASVLAHRHAGGQDGSVLIVGAGAMAREVSAALAKAGVPSLRWINRSAEGAARLATRFGGSSAPWDALDAEVMRASAVVTAVSAREPIVSAAVGDAAAARGTLLVDLGVPRNIAVTRARVLTIDEVRERREFILSRRRAAVPAVEALIADELAQWRQWVATRPMERLIRQLYIDEAEHRRGLVDALVEQSSVDPTAVDQIIWRSVRRLLHRHVAALRGNTASRSKARSGPRTEQNMETLV